MTSTLTEARVSNACATGKHHRCLGVVAVYPPVPGGGSTVPCACAAAGCDHKTRS